MGRLHCTTKAQMCRCMHVEKIKPSKRLQIQTFWTFYAMHAYLHRSMLVCMRACTRAQLQPAPGTWCSDLDGLVKPISQSADQLLCCGFDRISVSVCMHQCAVCNCMHALLCARANAFPFSDRCMHMCLDMYACTFVCTCICISIL